MFDALTLDHVRNKGEPKNKGPKAEIGVDSWGGAAAPPHQLGGLGSAVSSPAGFGAEPRPPKGFPLYSALRMASSDTIILLIVDYHAVVGGQDPRAPLCTPLMVRNCVNAAEDIVISNY